MLSTFNLEVIQKVKAYVLKYMYSEIADFKFFTFNHFNKGLLLQVSEDWEQLLANVARGQCRKSFRKLYDHFYPQLIGQNMKSGLSKEQSAEIAQESMIKIWNSAGLFDSSKGNIFRWIFIISRNVRYDYFRKLKNDPLQANSYDIYSDLDDRDVEENQLDFLFDIDIVKNHVEHLPNEQRDIIKKIYFDGFTHQEISDLDQIPLGTVKSRVRLAIASLKEKIGGTSK